MAGTNPGIKYLLVLNEPNLTSQSNVPPNRRQPSGRVSRPSLRTPVSRSSVRTALPLVVVPGVEPDTVTLSPVVGMGKLVDPLPITIVV